MEECGSAEKFWSFDPKLPNGPPYARRLRDHAGDRGDISWRTP